MADQIIKTRVIAPYFKGDGSQITGLTAVTDGASARLLIGQGTTSLPLWKDVSGDATISATGVISLDQSVKKTVTVNVSSAALLALHGTPLQLLAAPSAGQVIKVGTCTIQFKHTATAYLLGGAVAPVYHGATTALTGASLAAATILANADFAYELGPQTTAGGLALSSATGIDLYAATQEFTAGTGTAIVTLSYSIITLA